MSDRPLQVVLASTNDRAGGAGVAAARLRDGLRAQGHDARLFVQAQTVSHPATVSARGGLQRSLGRMRSGIDALALRPYGVAADSFSASWLPRRWPGLADAGPRDVVHLHWTNGGFLSVADIGAIRGPVVWTLHDMWALTGGCQYDAGCGRFVAGCGACPVLRSDKADDLSARRFRAKREHWRRLRLTAVAPSRWMAAEAGRSPLFEGKRVEVLRNGIDLRRYQPLDRGVARQALGLPAGDRLVLFGALNPGSDARKGYDLLQAAIGHLPSGGEALSLVVFGSSPEREESLHGRRVFHLGHLNDDIALALVYAACDVFVAPSRQENLPNTVAEALACGVPCVAFDVGGMPDLIEHCRNGYLATPFDPADLAHGIGWCLDRSDDRWSALSDNARRFAVEHLDTIKQTQRHVALYRDMLNPAASPT